ncbi:NAD(P)/FAD-dependent oxidoreductase [Actinomadura sp. WMMB 499]|uniref:flavin-containing monooxygenase n=1 Tax=Actinomadura sp. WMMB 499 TaxID=1219491 RepID=UPI0012485B9A|nr:NAD(P)/FAD-dependent oxidoreductase [Actinomadura sp. WMMB 499]QFG22111.1 NAD(P)/FAD-dependent oxidoreductase [Actinomadura sp. WMMB 499]
MPVDPPEHVDVLIVGAGLAGVGAACRLRAECPGKSVAIIEARERIGGTWDQFRYPGVRSDSDMQTLGYDFRPWRRTRALADGGSIRRYIADTAREHGLEPLIRFGRRVVRAEWSSTEARWHVDVEPAGGADGAGGTDGAGRTRLTCDFLHLCTGYYRYDEGYLPDWPGTGRFTGRLVHPQHWPDDLDHTGKRVIVIGSGATAVTLVPAMAGTAAHVTMLQRSPAYVVSIPGEDAIAAWLARVLPSRAAHWIVRWKNVLLITLGYRAARYAPRLTRAAIRARAARLLPSGYDIGRHFDPRHEPWEQRVCFVPDGDLFAALRERRASIVTDRIDTFTERGIRLASGAELEADVIVAATGLNVRLLGGARIVVDGRPVDPARAVGYKAMMLSGVPNLSFAIGYTNASWTLKCDLVARYLCRLIDHMDAHGYRQCTPVVPDASLPTVPFVDLTSGYIQRARHLLPRQGTKHPWRIHGNYLRDRLLYRRGRLDDAGIVFSRGTV